MKEVSSPLHRVPWHISRYVFALASVALALGVALSTWHYGIRHQFSMFLFAIAVTAWYFGTGPAISALVCSTLATIFSAFGAARLNSNF